MKKSIEPGNNIAYTVSVFDTERLLLFCANRTAPGSRFFFIYPSQPSFLP